MKRQFNEHRTETMIVNLIESNLFKLYSIINKIIINWIACRAMPNIYVITAIISGWDTIARIYQAFNISCVQFAEIHIAQVSLRFFVCNLMLRQYYYVEYCVIWAVRCMQSSQPVVPTVSSCVVTVFWPAIGSVSALLKMQCATRYGRCSRVCFFSAFSSSNCQSRMVVYNVIWRHIRVVKHAKQS